MKQLDTPWTVEKDYVSAERHVFSGWVIRNAHGKHICTISNARPSAEAEANYIVGCANYFDGASPKQRSLT